MSHKKQHDISMFGAGSETLVVDKTPFIFALFAIKLFLVHIFLRKLFKELMTFKNNFP